jgi:hypothetical protein
MIRPREVRVVRVAGLYMPGYRTAQVQQWPKHIPDSREGQTEIELVTDCSFALPDRDTRPGYTGDARHRD